MRKGRPSGRPASEIVESIELASDVDGTPPIDDYPTGSGSLTDDLPVIRIHQAIDTDRDMPTLGHDRGLIRYRPVDQPLRHRLPRACTELTRNLEQQP